MKEIPSAANLTFKGQSPKERSERLKKWFSVLSEIPYSELVKDVFETESSDPFVNDNQEEFGDSLFILKVAPDLDYHAYALLIIYFCFKANGTGYVSVDQNISEYGLDDSVVNAMLEHTEERDYDDWKAMLSAVIKMLNEAYGHKIPLL